MKLRKGLRVLLWIVAGLGVAGVGLYLLRWPLLEGTIRAKLSELVGTQLKADADVKSLSGSLLWSITAKDATLKARPGGPIRSATADRVHVVYGFLGSGEPSLTVESARIVLAASDGPAPPLHETIRNVVSVLRSLRFSGTVRAKRVDVVLPDGRVLALEEGTLDHATWSLTLRTEGFGAIEGSATLRLDGSFTFEGKAAEGPIRSARIDLGSGRERCPMSVTTELLGHPLTWSGTATFDKDRLSRAEGELSVKEGKARTVADFTTGRIDSDVDAVVTINEEFKGDLAVTGRLEGPIAGPVDSWTLREGTVKTHGANFRTFGIDEAELQLGKGSLAEVPFHANARSGDDRADAGGLFRWKAGKPDFDASVRATVADPTRWLALLPKPPDLKASQVQVEGKVSLHQDAVAFDGSGSIGEGSYQTLTWKSATVRGTVAPERIELLEGSIAGSAFAPSIAVSGKLEGDTFLIRLKAGADEADLGGRIAKDGGFEGRVRIDGPLDWAKSQGIPLPAWLKPVHLAGKVTREKDDTRVLLDITGGDMSLAPSASIRRNEKEWWIALAPGTLTMPSRRVEYSAVLLKVSPEKISADNLQLACSDPELSGRLSGSVGWDAKETKITFVAAETLYRKIPLETLVARATLDHASGEIRPQLRWGKEDGDHLRIQGVWGGEVDLTAELVARDLEHRPLLKSLLPSVALVGAVSLDARVTGTPEEPAVNGSLSLTRITTADLPALTLVIPIRTEGKVLKFWGAEEQTAYGRIEIDGTVPLPGSDVPVGITVRVVSRDFTPLLDRMLPQTRIWIPRGELSVEMNLAGPLGKAVLTGRADFYAESWRPPAPLPEATALRMVARLDEAGVVVDMADGLLGKAPFWASGRWDLFRPGKPLNLWVTAQQALVVDDPLVRLRVTPDAELTWAEGKSLKLTGRLEVPLVIYHREFSAAVPGGRTAARQVATPRLRLIPAESGGFLIPGIEGLDMLEIDLRVKSTGEVRIENSVVGVLVSVDGQLGGTPTEPALSGTIRSRERRGEVKLAPGVFMRIESAEAFLPEAPGRSPTIQFQGRVGTGEGAIQILVNGPMESPSLALKSDPPMPQKDLLSRLAFGLGTGTVSGETGVATLAVLLYEQAQNKWPDADSKESFLDRLRPSVIPGESTQRRVPWELPPTGTVRSTSLRTEYVYNSYFSIIAETNREGDVGGDLKFRIRF